MTTCSLPLATPHVTVEKSMHISFRTETNGRIAFCLYLVRREVLATQLSADGACRYALLRIINLSCSLVLAPHVHVHVHDQYLWNQARLAIAAAHVLNRRILHLYDECYTTTGL